MNKNKRILTIFLCIPLLFALFANALGAGTPAGEQATYVLNHQVDGDNYNGPALQYFSPYRLACTLNRERITMKNCLFALYNTTNDQVIPAYCSDITVLANANYAYRRINLEDSTFAASAAGQIRAIVQNGFYVVPIDGESDEAHAVRVEQELARLGAAAGVEDLTIGEAITGTQAAIWQAAHGTGLNYTDFLNSMYMSDISDQVRYYDICNEERINGHHDYNGIQNENARLTAASDRWGGKRIQSVYTYLMSLAPVPPNASIVSTADFRRIEGPYASDNGDGTFDLEVNVSVNVRVEEGDFLLLTASLGEPYEASATLADGYQTVNLKIANVPEALMDDTVILSISGQQSGDDVYLFDSVGDRETSQSMVGKFDGRLPVYAEIAASISEAHTDRILNFYKTTLIPNGTDNYDRFPLEGITFDIFYVAELGDYLAGRVKLPEAVDYEYPAMADFTLVTGADGRTSINFTRQGMPDGVYLVVEREHPAIKAPVDPFYVIMPTTNAQGTGYDYEVTVQPKNDLKGIVKIEKDVISLGNDSASVDAYENHTWIIGTNVPEDIAGGKSFLLSDTLDPRLDYVGNVRVQVETKDGQTVLLLLEEGEDYILNVTDVDSLGNGTPSDAFSVSLTPEGMIAVAGGVGEHSFDDCMLRVYFDARINANAEMGEEIPNEARLDYTNSVNFDFSAKSDKPVVYTGGMEIRKEDALDATVTLPGAVFEVYRKATEQEVAAGEGISHIPGVTAPVVRVSFFDNSELKGTQVTSVTTDRQGSAKVYGLAYGDYYLLETKAPAGYNFTGEAIAFTVDGQSHTPDRIITVENIQGSVLPSTGGPGTEIYMIMGTILLCGAAALLLLRRRQASA